MKGKREKENLEEAVEGSIKREFRSEPRNHEIYT